VTHHASWTVDVISLVDGDTWKLAGDDTFRFYQTHGIGRPAALKRHITTRMAWHVTFLVGRYEDPRVEWGAFNDSNPPGHLLPRGGYPAPGTRPTPASPKPAS